MCCSCAMTLLGRVHDGFGRALRRYPALEWLLALFAALPISVLLIGASLALYSSSLSSSAIEVISPPA